MAGMLRLKNGAELARLKIANKSDKPAKLPPYGGKLHRASKLEAEFAQQIHLAGLGAKVVREYRFSNSRKYRFDFAWPEQKLAVETHGGIHTAGRHTRGSGFENDRDKINTALALGWRVLELTPRTVKSGLGLKWLASLLQNSPNSDPTAARRVILR